MIAWMARWVVWFAIRVVVTLACIYSIQNIIHQEGYRVEFTTLLLASICAIIAIRMWMPSSKESEKINPSE
jgi:uncharacterized membrane protein